MFMSVLVASGDPVIDGLLWGVKWDGTVLLYSFPSAMDAYPGYNFIHGLEKLNVAQQAAANSVATLASSLTHMLIYPADATTEADLHFAVATSVDDGTGEYPISTASGN